MNRAELKEYVTSRLGAEKGLKGGQVLAELLEAIGVQLEADKVNKHMSCDAIVDAFLVAKRRHQAVHEVKSSRKRIKSFSTIETLVDRIQTATQIVVIIGAGVSTASGVPDFRSRGGIYDRIRTIYGDLFDDPQILFDASQFKLDPSPFFRLMYELTRNRDEWQPTKCHQFLHKLELQDRLLRVYTQNVDGLEASVGLTRVVYCHGTMATSTCVVCGQKSPTGTIDTPTSIPTCADDKGILRPDVIFFGQDLPATFFSKAEADLAKADLVLIIGSSLKVHPVASLVNRFRPRVPVALINREIVGQPNEFDLNLLGDCEAIVSELEKRLGWEDEENGEDDTEQKEILEHKLNANTYAFATPSVAPSKKRSRH